MSGPLPAQRSSGDLNAMTTEQIISHYLAMNPGSSENAFTAALHDRKDSEGQGNLNLRDAEHYLYARSQIENPQGRMSLWPLSNRTIPASRLSFLLGVPIYSAKKALEQYVVPPRGGQTKPDFSEIYWGMRPAFEMKNPPTFKQRPLDPREP